MIIRTDLKCTVLGLWLCPVVTMIARVMAIAMVSVRLELGAGPGVLQRVAGIRP